MRCRRLGQRWLVIRYLDFVLFEINFHDDDCRHHVCDYAIFAYKYTVFKNVECIVLHMTSTHTHTHTHTKRNFRALHIEWAIGLAFDAHKWQKVTCPTNERQSMRTTRWVRVFRDQLTRWIAFIWLNIVESPLGRPLVNGSDCKFPCKMTQSPDTFYHLNQFYCSSVRCDQRVIDGFWSMGQQRSYRMFLCDLWIDIQPNPHSNSKFSIFCTFWIGFDENEFRMEIL